MSRERARFKRGTLHLGDCLEVLRELERQKAERFDLVYVDPPFNTGRPFGARKKRGERARGARAYVDRWGGLDGFLEMLSPRVSAAARLLKREGSLFVHLDHRAVHDAKVRLDRELGPEAYQGEIIWMPGNGARRKNGPTVTHQTLLIYAPSGSMRWNTDDPSLREPYAGTSQKMHFTSMDESGRFFRERTIAGKTYRYYADRGRRIGSVWTDCPAMRANTPLVKESTGYPTQKPEKLLERIILATTPPKGRVLDPMCGSGTTLSVAARLGRSFVGMDASRTAFSVAKRRLEEG